MQKRVLQTLNWLLVIVMLLTLAPVAVFAAPLAQEEITCAEEYTVQADDWLSKIADKYLGNMMAYPAIVEATNQKHAVDDTFAEITDPDFVDVGWKICVPSGETAQALLEAEATTTFSISIQPDDEKVLSMYVAYGGPDLIAEEFEKATGIKVEFLTMSSGEVLTRLQAEKANPQTDVWFGGGSDAFIQAKQEGLTEAYKSSNAENVNPAFRDEEGYWTGVSVVVVGFLVNDDRLNDKGLAMPEEWADLADPAYKDELMASNPNTSGTAYTTVSGILQVMGEEAGWGFLDKMYANIPYLEKSGSAPANKALAGEYAIGIVPDPHVNLIRNPDAPLTEVFPTDGVLAWPSPVAVVAGAKHPNNAKIFVDWCLSPEGQKVLMKASPRVPTTNVETIEGVPSVSELNLVAYDHLKWGAERERVIEEFNTRYPQYQ